MDDQALRQLALQKEKEWLAVTQERFVVSNCEESIRKSCFLLFLSIQHCCSREIARKQGPTIS